MFAPLFWFFAALTLVFAVLVVVNRSPVASALSLVLSFLGLAALFVGLDAYLIGVLQVLVYAGAVMVLFLFIIMLLDLRAEQRRKLNFLGVIGGGLVTFAFIAQLFVVLRHHPAGSEKFAALTPPPARVAGEPPRLDDVQQIGAAIFTRYNLPLQVVGVLILVSTIGVVVLSKRELK